jgi:8-oxo-dGTP diphosphatase
VWAKPEADVHPPDRPSAVEKPIAVGIGLISRNGRFLVRRRPEETVYAGYWEFPGGKCEPGELPVEAVERECLEETGMAIVVGRRRCMTLHRYPHGLVELHFHDCTPAEAASEPEADTGFCWVPAQELTALRFPEANEPIVAELAREAEGAR